MPITKRPLIDGIPDAGFNICLNKKAICRLHYYPSNNFYSISWIFSCDVANLFHEIYTFFLENKKYNSRWKDITRKGSIYIGRPTGKVRKQKHFISLKNKKTIENKLANLIDSSLMILSTPLFEISISSPTCLQNGDGVCDLFCRVEIFDEISNLICFSSGILPKKSNFKTTLQDCLYNSFLELKK